MMEKTIKYLLQEAYVNGYNDAREAVAKDIEAEKCHEFIDDCYGVNGEHCDIVKRLSDIARGK